MNLHHRPLFLFVIAYICGIVSASGPNLHPVAGFGIGGGIFLVGCMLPTRLVPRILLALVAAVFAIGFARTEVYKQAPHDDVSQFAKGKLVHLTGVVVSDPERRENRVQFVLTAEHIRTYSGEFSPSGRVMVTLYDPQYETPESDAPRVTPFFGDTVCVYGRLKEPLPRSNPAGLDYAQYLARKRIFCTLSAAATDITVARPAPKTPKWYALKFKEGLTSRVLRLFPPLEGRLLLAIFLGNYAYLPVDVHAAFMRCGSMHLFAASGFHCGVLIAIFGFFLRRLTSPRAMTHILLIVVLWGYSLVVGPSPSIVRAATMVTVFLSAYLLRRAPDSINIVLFAALVILAVNPLSLYNIGFQLSFAAVISIVLMLPLVEPFVHEFLAPPGPKGRRLSIRAVRAVFWSARNLILAFLISLAVVLGTWPITAYYFNYFSAVSVIANALNALLVLFLTALGIASVALGAISSLLGHVLALAGTICAKLTLGVADGLGSLSWAFFSTHSPSPVFLAAYYILLFGGLEYAYRKTASLRAVARNP